MRVKLDGIHIIKRRLPDGGLKEYHYHRGTKAPLPGKPGSEAYYAAWRAAEATIKARRSPASTVRGLIDQFKDSADWQQLRETTRAIMKVNLNAVDAKFHDFPIAALDDRRARSEFLTWRDGLAKATPRAADAKLAALQRVLSWAFDRGLAPANPLEKFRRIYSADRSEKVWLPEHITAMEAASTPQLAFAMLLALHTGQRQGDLLRLTWRAFDGKGLSLIQSKTRTRVYIPCTAALLTLLRAAKASAGDNVTILVSPAGRAWSSDGFKKAWRAAFAESAITDDLHFHDLRGTAVTMLAEAGCTVPEICAITGHSLASATRILEAYLSKTKALATAAILKLDEHARNKIVKTSVKTA